VPTYKHPCPHCDRLIQRDVAACPYCGTPDPFAPRRCAACRTPLDDPAWTACPRCGAATGRAAATGASAGAVPSAPAAVAGAPSAPVPVTSAPSTSPDRACAGCSAPLPEGARFCTVCGTLAG
jgi:predicted amidophosphoribosyltransferase